MNAAPSLFDEPLARLSDPSTSHLAAVSVRPANQELVQYIRAAIERCGPLTQEEIAVEVGRAQPGRWTAGTIVTCCARAHLFEWDVTTNGRGRRVTIWSITPTGIETVEVDRNVL